MAIPLAPEDSFPFWGVVAGVLITVYGFLIRKLFALYETLLRTKMDRGQVYEIRDAAVAQVTAAYLTRVDEMTETLKEGQASLKAWLTDERRERLERIEHMENSLRGEIRELREAHHR